MKNIILILFIHILVSKYGECVDFKNLIFTGYQGWFTTPSSSVKRWSHWSPGVSPEPGKVTFELYPDTTDYPSSVLEPTNLGSLGDGSLSVLFQSDSDEVINVHLSWMKQYGIDGLAVQRFVTELYDPLFEALRTSVLKRIMKYSSIHQRYFYLMYDISGAPEPTFVNKIITDFENLINTTNLLNHPYYIRQENKPVVCVWGFGFPDRPGSANDAKTIANYFKSKNIYLIFGVPYQWRESTSGVKPGFSATIFGNADMIQPWSVGAFASSQDLMSANQLNIIAKDKEWCIQNLVDYQRIVWPGFAWSNWNGGAKNMIPRKGGQFIRDQVNVTISKPPVFSSFFIAMFDEYDEGTAIMKAATNSSKIPKSQYFLTLDADGLKLDSDHYLKVAGEIIKSYHNVVDPIVALFDRTKKDRLISTTYLKENEAVTSDNSNIVLSLQNDGNLVLTNIQTSQILWSSKTSGKGNPPYQFSVQNDGNLVLYGGASSIWSSVTAFGQGYGPYVLLVNNQGYLTLYNHFGQLIWKTV